MATVLVAGGTGQVGQPIVAALLERGDRVVVPSRSRDSLEALRDRLGDPSPEQLMGQVIDLADAGGGGTLRDVLASDDVVPDAVVASLGGWWSGPRVVDVDDGTWRRLLDGSLTAHLRLARAFVPALTEGGTYLLLNGGGARSPVPGSGPVVVSAAAQLMLARVLAEEHADDPVRIATLVIETPVKTRDRPDGPEQWLTGEQVASAVVGILAGAGAGAGAGPVLDLTDADDVAALAPGAG